MKKKRISLLLFGLISFNCSAQTTGYKFYSLLDTIKKSGFYNIEITPELNAHLKTDYSDLRVINAGNKWVPHILRNPAAEKSDTQISMDLKFTKTENTRTHTILEIENSFPLISNITLVIRNTAAERFCTLSGSDDRYNWFILNDSILLNPAPAANNPENTLRIDFPPSSYTYFKLIIHNNNKDPFDVKGVLRNTSAAAILNADHKLIKNPASRIEQKDSGQISYVKITQQQPWHFDHIGIKPGGVTYFIRKAELYVPLGKDHTFSKPGQLLQSFTLSNNSTLEFSTPLSKAGVFYLLIYNDDNLPLTITEVKTALHNRYLSAYLEKDSQYRLMMDNDAAILPNYDLPLLNSKIPDSVSYVETGEITAFPENESAVKPEKKNHWLLWSAITGALMILLFFTYKMLKEVDKSKTT